MNTALYGPYIEIKDGYSRWNFFVEFNMNFEPYDDHMDTALFRHLKSIKKDIGHESMGVHARRTCEIGPTTQEQKQAAEWVAQGKSVAVHQTAQGEIQVITNPRFYGTSCLTAKELWHIQTHIELHCRSRFQWTLLWSTMNQIDAQYAKECRAVYWFEGV